MRRLVLLASAIVLVDTLFYSVVAPLLPHYSDELGLSEAPRASSPPPTRPGRCWARCPAGCWPPEPGRAAPCWPP